MEEKQESETDRMEKRSQQAKMSKIKRVSGMIED